MQWGFRQCLFALDNIKGKHCRRPIAVMGVVDHLGPTHLLTRPRISVDFFGQKEKKLISLKKFCMGVGNRHPVLLHSRSCEGTESSHFVLRHLSFVQRAISLG
jgi:hypothetical protein